mmetsp:Transcript_144896/g.255410  ORF Transcript_144896/g.255410 Transcript_144896/m.255410 type:complete len:285 (-) Transcript_144896:62-916(-)
MRVASHGLFFSSLLVLAYSLTGQGRQGRHGVSRRLSAAGDVRSQVTRRPALAIDARGHAERTGAASRKAPLAESRRPKVVLMVLDKEREAGYVNQTLASLEKNSYDFEIMSAIDGPKLGLNGIKKLTNLRFHSKLGPEAQGCFASHVMAWRKAQQLRRPVISLESDTAALSPWMINSSVYDHYDMLVAHNSPWQTAPCDLARGQYVEPGTATTYGTGAILFTGRRYELLEELLQKEITVPIDHWINSLVADRLLQVGALCPSMFAAYVMHKSTVEVAKLHKWSS